MADIGLNQNITVKNRTFHIQTSTNLEEGIVRSEVFEQGRILFTEVNRYERRDYSQESGAELRLRRLVDKIHQGMIRQFETLFEIAKMVEEQQNKSAHHRIGVIFLSLHLYDKAEEHLQKAINLDPEYYSAYVSLGRCYFLQKKYEQALYTLEPLVQKDVAFADLYNLLGLVQFEQKNYLPALNHFRQAIRINPNYREALFNLAAAILGRLDVLRMQQKKEELKKNLNFFGLVMKRIEKLGIERDKKFLAQVKQALETGRLDKIQALIYDYRQVEFIRPVAPEVVGFEFYLWLKYLPERLDREVLLQFEERILDILNSNGAYPDLWNYLALIHLMLCRDHFLQGLEDFREATKINPRYVKARKNLRLVENDGREFLSLIKAIVKD